ncbi:hypothetical protein PGTUg99_033809 [Puccinia graminis f. sp. tritici]|uniref:Uncharacterized protein n=1 Tax=Puccinia graminis f. sp. tritici TaxID=56615 RepID=A0A5B0QRY6_PUCGR|nr:hypothetical protein PGTUg99_033809 [Puccinia graminis f. sp. tritici]
MSEGWCFNPIYPMNHPIGTAQREPEPPRVHQGHPRAKVQQNHLQSNLFSNPCYSHQSLQRRTTIRFFVILDKHRSTPYHLWILLK